MWARRSRWSSAELNFLRQLYDEGIDIPDMEPLRESHRLPLRISDGTDVSRIVELGRLNTGYLLSLQLVSPSRLYLEECCIESDLHSDIELVDFDERRDKFGSRTFRPQEVLNSKFGERAALTRGRVLEGYLLACAYAPIPSHAKKGSYGVRVTIFDTLERSASKEFRISLDRPSAAKDDHHGLPSGASASAKSKRSEISPNDQREGIASPSVIEQLENGQRTH